MSDSFDGIGNYEAFNLLMKDIIFAVHPREDFIASDAFEGTQTINLGRVRFSFLDGLPLGCDIELSSRWDETSNRILIYTRSPENWLCDLSPSQEYSVSPDEYIMIVTSSDIVLEGNQVFTKGRREILPAYFLHYYIKEKANDRARSAITFCIDAGLMATGVGELAAGSKLLRGLAIADLFIGTGGTIITLSEDEIIANYGESGRTFINAYRILSLGAAAVNIGAGVRQAYIASSSADMESSNDFIAFVKQNRDEINDDPSIAAEFKQSLTQKVNLLEGLTEPVGLMRSHLRMRMLRNGGTSDLAETLADQLLYIFINKGWTYEKLTDDLARILIIHGDNGPLISRLADWDTNIFNRFLDDLAGNAILVTRMANEPGLVRAWERLREFPSISTNTSYLEIFSRQIRDFPEVSFDNTSYVVAQQTDAHVASYFARLDSPRNIDELKVLAGDFPEWVTSGSFPLNAAIQDIVNVPSSNLVNLPESIRSFYETVGSPSYPQHSTFTNSGSLTGRPDKIEGSPVFSQNNHLQLVKLKPNAKIYRVFDIQGTAKNGGYWTLDYPTSRAEFRAETAVLPEWNSGTLVVELTIPSEGIYAWRGFAAPQRIINPNDVSLPNEFLSGGGEQIFLPYELWNTSDGIHSGLINSSPESLTGW